MDISPQINQLGLSELIKRLNDSEEQNTSAKVWDYYFGESNGQCRTDRKLQFHDMVGVQLGHAGSPLLREGKVIEMNEIHIGQSQLNKTYTILDGSYANFIADTLHAHLGDPCWFLPSKGLHRPSVYEGQLGTVLSLIEDAWDDLYEFTISSPDLSWMVDYNHHHSIIVYGDKEAGRAQFLCKERRKWQEKVLSCNFYPKIK
jgi:hypothetical protein